MKIESVEIRNFRCFGAGPTKIRFEHNVTALVGGNGSGKTTAFLALSRLFGISPSQRSVRRQDFHLRPDQQELLAGVILYIDVVFSFPELEGPDREELQDAVPEFFLQMAASAPEMPLKARMRLQATWDEDGTPDGAIDEDIRWITTLGADFEWDECKRVQAAERGSIQLIYVPAARDAATQVTTLLKGRLWQAARWSNEFKDQSAKSAASIQALFEGEEPTRFVISRLTNRWAQVHEGDTDTIPVLRLIENRFEELVKKAEFSFSPDEAGQERAIVDLSDGQSCGRVELLLCRANEGQATRIFYSLCRARRADSLDRKFAGASWYSARSERSSSTSLKEADAVE